MAIYSLVEGTGGPFIFALTVGPGNLEFAAIAEIRIVSAVIFRKV